MKYRLTRDCLRRVILTIAFTTPVLLSAQLSGNYTINPTGSATSTNYLDWSSAISDMVSGSRSDGGTAQGSGVSGAVVFTVYDTVYSGVSLDIAAITGASSTNTITFRSAGGDSSQCILRYASSTSSTNDYIIHLNGADYITFRQIGFERTGSSTYSTVVQISNDADNNSFIRCYFRGHKMPSNSSLGFNYGIGSCIYITGNTDYLTVDRCRLLYGYNGVYGATSCTGNIFSHNVIDTSGSSGIYMTGQSSLLVADNEFRMGDFGPNQGHYVSYGMRIESSPSMRITGNKIQMLAVNGQVVRAVILANSTSTGSSPALVYNNWIYNGGGTGDCTGFAIYACNYLNFMYNNVLINSSLSNGAGYYHYPQYTNSYIRLLSNNFVNKGAGYAVNVPGTNTGDIDSMDYNNLFSNGTYLGNWSGSNYSSLSAWRTNSGKDGNSMNVDPGFTSNTDLHVSNISINGKALLSYWVLSDIDGDVRDTTAPDIGADEFFPAARDAGITNVDSPSLFCAGTHTVRVRFQNYGMDTLKSVQIQWEVNASMQANYNWTGTLAPGASSSPVSIGTYAFSANTPYVFRVWTRNPNSMSDDRTMNDTFRITKLTGLTGTYTLGDTAGTDFKSFNDAINAMASRSICGPVTFKVRPGIYNEQITFLQLPGMGSSNPILFENSSGDSTRVVITLPSTTATGNNNAAIQLRGANYVSFKGVTFMRTGTNPFGHVVHILNSSHHNTFERCQMIGLRAGNSANAINIWSDQGQDNDNKFLYNHIKLGTYGMFYHGTSSGRETGTVVEGNVFDSTYNQAINISLNDGIIIHGNTFLSAYTQVTGNSHILLRDCDNRVRVSNNFFRGTNMENALFMNNCDGSTNARCLIANNAVMKPNGRGFVLDSTTNADVVFNSIYMTGSANTNAGVVSTNANNSGLTFRNNIVYLNGGDVFNVAWGPSVVTSDRNNLISRGAQFAYWGASCNSFPGLKATSGKDANSLSVDPYFSSATDLHILNPALKGAGVPVPGVTTDMDGELRDSLRPDIGADEFRLADLDAGATGVIQPFAQSCVGVLPVEVVIHNYGGDTLTSVTINWRVSGVAQTSFAWTGSLLNNQSDTVMLGNYNFSNLGNPYFEIWTSSPNGGNDAIRFNDTFAGIRSLRNLPNASAGQDQTICMGTGVTIGPSPVSGLTYEWIDIDAQMQVGTTSRITVNPMMQTIYELIVRDPNFGCSKRDTVTVNVNAVPIANAGPDKSVCYGSGTQIGTAAQSGFSYGWTSFPTGFVSSTAQPNVLPFSTTKYILTKTITATGCFDTDTVEVTVNLNPTPQITGTSQVCTGETGTYTTKLNTGSNYTWTAGGGSLITGQGTNGSSVRWTVPGYGALKVVETNAAGCKDSANYNVLINERPVAKFSVTEVCKGQPNRFYDSSTDAASYRWDLGDGTISGAQHPVHTYSLAGSYNIVLSIQANNGCTDTVTGSAYVNPVPVAGFRSVKNEQLEFTFTDTSDNGGGNIVSWSWNFGDGNTSTQQNPVHTYATVSIYTVTLCVKSDRGCEHCTSANVNAVGLEELSGASGMLIYPNPGTGLFTLQTQNPVERVEVYDATGRKVFEAMDIEGSLPIDLSGESNGVYFVRIQTANGNYAARLIKTN